MLSLFSRSLTRHHSTIRSLSSISNILTKARSETPLKDAIKFTRPSTHTNEKSFTWTFHELDTHVNALASGLKSLSSTKASGETIISTIPTYDPEYTVLFLACHKLSINLISVKSSVDEIQKSINEHKPVGLFVESNSTEQGGGDGGIIGKVNDIIYELDDEVVMKDSSGIQNGCVSVTGKQYSSNKYPFLKFIIHTGVDNVRCGITFKSLLVYDSSVIENSANTQESELISNAKKLGDDLQLSAEHDKKNGTVVVKQLDDNGAVAAIAALIKQSLWVSPHPDSLNDVFNNDNVVIV